MPVSRRLPGIADSIPYLVAGAVFTGYGLWLASSRTTASIGSFPLEIPMLGVGAILLAGGLLGSFVEDPDAERAGTQRSELDQPVVTTQEWLAMKAELASLKARRPEEPGPSGAAPWDEGPTPAVDTDERHRRFSRFDPSVQDAIRELETIEQDIAPRRTRDPKGQS